MGSAQAFTLRFKKKKKILGASGAETDMIQMDLKDSFWLMSRAQTARGRSRSQKVS